VSDDWLTFSHDLQRTSWNNADKTFTPESLAHFKLLWSTSLAASPSSYAAQTLTTPVVVSGIRTTKGVKTLAFTISGDNLLFAVDADTGKVVWKKSFPNRNTPIHETTWMCTNSEQATPVIDKIKGVLYFTTSDGKLHGVSLLNGAEKFTPAQMVVPFSRNWSLNLIDDNVYTSGGRGCGGDADDPMVSGNVDAANISDPAHVTVESAYTGFGRQAGPWNRGGPVFGPEGIYVSTADGRYDPASGFFGESVVAFRLGLRGVADSFTPSNWRNMNAHDLDLGGGSPLIFPFHGMALLAIGSKESIEYLLDANELGGFDHNTPLYASPKLGNDPNSGEQYGIWGGDATWIDSAGERYLYIPMMNAPSKDAPQFPTVNGDVSKASIMAFKVEEKGGKPVLIPAWISGVDLTPDTPATADGVVFVLNTGEQTVQNLHPDIQGALPKATFRNTPVGHQVLYAFDAETGKELYSSENLLSSWDHFGQPVVSNGKVFLVSHDAHIYAFGLK
jgi:outer membrane protein assembly factor BamB